MKFATLIIISSITLVGISLIIPSYVAYVSFSNELEETVTADISILAANAMDKLDRLMNGRIIDIQFLTSSSNDNLVGSQNSIKEKIEYLRDYEVQSQLYTSSSIYDLSGIKIADTRSLKIGLDESNELFFTEAIQGKIYHSEIPVESKSLSTKIIHFSGPMYDDNGNIDGVVVLRFSLSKINDILDSDTIYSKPIDVFLISSQGEIIYANHPQQGVLSEVMELQSMQEFLQSTNKQISFFEFNEEEGQEELFTIVKQEEFQQHEGDGWLLIFDIPTSVLFAEQIQVQNNFAIISGIILSFAIVASLILARHISSPIKVL